MASATAWYVFMKIDPDHFSLARPISAIPFS
jgi:hypothetical protein